MTTRLKTTLGFALACLLIVVAMVASTSSTSKFIDDTQWMVHTVGVRSEMEKMLTSFVTAQNNIRGYHMTEQDYYLELHRKAKAEVDLTVERLRELTKDNPSQQLLLEQISVLLDAKYAVWNRSFETRRKGGWEAIRNSMLKDELKLQDARLFEVVDILKGEEDRLLGMRIAQAHKQGSDAKLIVWMGGLLACALIGIATFLVYRDSRRREIAEDNIDRFFTLSLDLLCISGMDGYFKRLSPSYAETLGYSLEELYAEPITNFVHPDDIQPTNAEIARQMGGERVLSFENRFRCKDGSYRTFSWKSVPVGQFMYAVARDVTQQKVFERELVLAREAAQNAAVVKGEFLANMSHEIRTPLNGVVGMTDLLARTGLSPEQKNFLDGIRSSSMILLTVINEILDFSKIEAGRAHVEKTDFDLRQLIESRISLIGILAHEKGLEIDNVIDPEIPPILRGDAGKIGQVLLNLANNAVKFSDEGKIYLKTELLARTEKECKLKISVRDNGIGMTSEQMSRLFEPFVQVDGSSARKYGGTGLGLSISKQFVELMDGRIGVESQSGQGSTFWFSLPLEISSLQMLPATKTASGASDAPVSEDRLSRRKEIRILIAEDNRTNQVIVMSMMSALGYSAELVSNGEEAVKAVQNRSFDLILMDQHMPVMDGVEASRRIRKVEEGTGRRIPIIAFTATVIQNEQKAQFKLLMDDFLLKPVTMDALESVLSDWERRLARSAKV